MIPANSLILFLGHTGNKIRTMKFFLIFLLILLSSCSPSDSQSASIKEAPSKNELPNFIYNVYPESGATGEIYQRLCVDLNLSEIWGSAENPDKPVESIDKSFQFVLDGGIIQRNDAPIYTDGLLITIEKEGKRSRIPSLVFICTKAELGVGLHEAAIRFTSISGKVYSYNWSFRVDKSISNRNDRSNQIGIDFLIGIASNAYYPIKRE